VELKSAGEPVANRCPPHLPSGPRAHCMHIARWPHVSRQATAQRLTRGLCRAGYHTGLQVNTKTHLATAILQTRGLTQQLSTKPAHMRKRTCHRGRSVPKVSASKSMLLQCFCDVRVSACASVHVQPARKINKPSRSLHLPKQLLVTACRDGTRDISLGEGALPPAPKRSATNFQ